MAQEPNWNGKPEPLEPFFQEAKLGQSLGEATQGTGYEERLRSSPALKVQYNKAKMEFREGTKLIRSSPAAFSKG